MKKRIILITLVCLVACAVSFGVTYAFLITQESNSNVFIVGEIRAEVEEDFEPPAELHPNSSFKKAPYARNTGNLPCFIRMRADYSTVKAGSFCTLTGGSSEYWELGADGYYYYKQLLDPGELTAEPPFDHVDIGNCNENDLENFDILIYVEAIQHTDHNGDHAATEYKDAWSAYHSS